MDGADINVQTLKRKPRRPKKRTVNGIALTDGVDGIAQMTKGN